MVAQPLPQHATEWQCIYIYDIFLLKVWYFLDILAMSRRPGVDQFLGRVCFKQCFEYVETGQYRVIQWFTDGYCPYTSHTNTKASHHFSLYSAMPYEDGSVTMCTSWYLRFSTIQFTYSAFKHFHMTHIGYIGIFCLPDTLPKSIFSPEVFDLPKLASVESYLDPRRKWLTYNL